MNAILLETERWQTLPADFTLLRTYPNPFNPSTTIEFTAPQSGLVTLTVYDLIGREVVTILNRRMDAGRHLIQWDASHVSSGVYFVTMESGDFRQVRKVTVLR